ncbi:hypothetical protein EC973_001027 [Apophysomyces ossiformis]|uniref:CRAL-TRIO domain-containing protein n=1 Tax=Apophysomyces ossiformis TaxID=679940 RepID=A0A8H7BY38_9FUNG|nr:hypothetical protein EC973_001027 [Apophysomyces ossiformis]
MSIFKLRPSASTNTKASSVIDVGPATHDPILTPPSDYAPILHPPLDDSQQHQLDQLREYMKTIMLPEDHEYYLSEKGFLSDGTLKRYLRARKWVFEAAKVMLENTVKWRREFRPDQLDPDYIRPEAETGKMYYNGFDKHGRPLWWMKPRYQNSKDAERQVKHIVFCLERGIRLMPSNVETIDIVIDFKDSSSSHNPSIATSKKFLDILSNHYPERLGVAFVVKSPWFFLTSFKIISPFIDPVTKAKIKFVHDSDKVTYDDNNKPPNNSELVFLQDYIPLEQLEAEFGGKHNFEFRIEQYWNQLLDRTGKPYNTIEYV